jgi:DNA-binding transcriptional ArsR family regulator
MLEQLLGGDALPAAVLAAEARVGLSTASAHLDTLARAGLIVVERQGRQHRYRLANENVAQALEALALVAPPLQRTSVSPTPSMERLREGRTCYDHLAGRLGVGITEALLAARALRLKNRTFETTRKGERMLWDLGVDPAIVAQRKRAFAIPCLDWTERRVHLAGALGAALCERLIALEWVRRASPGRAVIVTAKGRAALRSTLGLESATHQPKQV